MFDQQEATAEGNSMSETDRNKRQDQEIMGVRMRYEHLI